jgi:hypothetical protein
VCFENAFHTGSNYDVTVLSESFPFPEVKFLSVVDETGVELVFLVRDVSTKSYGRVKAGTRVVGVGYAKKTKT